MPKFDVSQWRILLLRLTGFPAGEMPSADERSWWQTAAGKAPETRTVKGRLGTVEETGPIALPEQASHAKLTIVSNPNRVDMRVSALEVDIASNLPDDIGPVTAVMPVIVQLARRWLDDKTVPDLKRLALGAVLVHPAPSSEEAHRQLAEFLPNVKLPEEAADLLYQINRRRPSKTVSKLTLNRLTKWSVGLTTVIRVDSATNATVMQSSPSCVLDLDINTPADRSESLPGAEIPHLLEEMVDMALELAARGDIP